MASTSPSGVIARPLVALVPTSMPKSTVMCQKFATKPGAVAWAVVLAALSGSPTPPPDPDPRPATPRPGRYGKKVGIAATFFPSGRCGDRRGGGKAEREHHLAATARPRGWTSTRSRTESRSGGCTASSGACTPSAGRPITPHEWASAAVLACGPGAALSHGSAMALWGYWRRWDKPFEVTVVGDRRPAGSASTDRPRCHRRDVTTHMGIRVTSPARTVLDVSPRQTDRALKRTVNNALNSQWLTEDQLADTLARHPTLPGATAHRHADRPARHPDPLALGRRLSGLLRGPRLAGAGDGRADCGYLVDALFVGRTSDRRARQLAVPQGQDRVRDRPRARRGHAGAWASSRSESPRSASMSDRNRRRQRLHAILRTRRAAQAHAPRAA